MIPSCALNIDFHGSLGEEKVYNALKTLPQEYTVFHSVHWQQKRKNGTISWGETDFTVFHPKRGLITLEVKSGGIKHDDCGWSQINTVSGDIYQMKDPLVQAERSKFTFIDILETQSNNQEMYWVEAAVWFPSVQNFEAIGSVPPAYTREITLTESDLLNATKSIVRIFDYYHMYERGSYSIDDEKRIIEFLSPCFDAIPSIATRIAEEEYIMHRLTNEQSYILDYLEEQRIAAIQGGAGTGKTMLALEKAKRLSSSGKVLFLCFNKFLLAMLRNSSGEDFSNVDFFNLPSMVCHYTGQADAGGRDGISEFLLAFEPHNWPYAHIIIDEGQDFHEDHLLLLSAIAERQKGSYYVFYDKNQLVQQRQSLDWVKSVECRLILSTNCRNTRSIATTAYRPVGVDEIKMRTEILGEKPTLYITPSKDAVPMIIAALIRRYTHAGLQKKQIVILTVKTEETSVLQGLTSVGTYRLSSDMNTQSILFTSARKFKGLESDVIILVDMDESSFLSEEAKRVLYVGASRAKHYLDIVTTMSDHQLNQTAEVLQGRPAKNPKTVIASLLKVKISAAVPS